MGNVRGWPIGGRDRVLENLQYTSSSQNESHSDGHGHSQNQRHSREALR